MWPNMQESVDLVAFTKEILTGKPFFLSSGSPQILILFLSCVCTISLLYWIPIFHIASNEAFWQCCGVSLVCTPSVLVLRSLKQYVQLFHHQQQINDWWIECFFHWPGLVLLQYCFQFLSLSIPFSTDPMILCSYFLWNFSKLSIKRFSFILFSMFLMYFLFSSFTFVVFNDLLWLTSFNIFSFEVSSIYIEGTRKKFTS